MLPFLLFYERYQYNTISEQAQAKTQKHHKFRCPLGTVYHAAGGKRVDTCGFYPLGTPVSLCFMVWRRPETGDRSEIRGTAEDFFYRREAQCVPMSLLIRSVRQHTATQIGESAQARHARVARIVRLDIMDGTCEDKWYRTPKS